MERQWLTLDQIKAEYASNDYNPELLLQHLLHHVEARSASVPEVTDAQIDRLLSVRVPGGSEARDWFLPHESEKGLENVRQVVRLMLAAAPTPPVSEDRWLPIETAPKDEFVLLAGPSGYTTIETVFSTGRMCSDYHVGRWIDHANDDLTDWGFEPTHWMPLPKAPTMQEDKKP